MRGAHVRRIFVLGLLAGPLLLLVGAPAGAASSTVTYHADFTANDVSGAHDGTWVGTARYAPGVTGAAGDGAFAFTGDGSSILMDQSVGTFGTDQATISFDVQTTYSGFQQSLMGERSVCNNPAEGWWDIRETRGAINVEFGGAASYINAIGNTNISDGLWHHVVVTRDGSGVTIKVDGVLDADAVGPPADINPSVPFGVDNSPCIGVDGTQPMQGNIDEINVTRGSPTPTSTEQCKKGGWQAYGVFKNQGDCVSFVATGGKNPPG